MFVIGREDHFIFSDEKMEKLQKVPFRSILTLQEIQQNNFTGNEIRENIISEGLAGKKIFFETLKMGEKLVRIRVKLIFSRSEITKHYFQVRW